MQSDELTAFLIVGFLVVSLIILLKHNLKKASSGQSRPPPFNAKNAHKLDAAKTITGRAYIVDGDTVKIKNTQIRLFGVDAPELDHPFGIKAKWALHLMCKGHEITAVITDIDHYGRAVAACYLPDGSDV